MDPKFSNPCSSSSSHPEEVPMPSNNDWDPTSLLSNLSFLEHKIHQLQDLVNLIIGHKHKPVVDLSDELVAQQHQLVTADLTSIIVQLISTAGTLLPSLKNPVLGQLQTISGLGFPPNNNSANQIEHVSKPCLEQHIHKDEEDENLPPGSYEVLQLEKEEILAPHTHFCFICGKGFKRDANLRMHMRGHGDEYKTPAALAKPNKEPPTEPLLTKRYSCPYLGCKRNKDHKKFQPLKTILCVKNHYKRTHCDKSYVCSRCNSKKFSVLADLKTHEKHCGRDKWLCSCGTTFSRKDKLFGHVALFQGHTPALPAEETKGPWGSLTGVETTEATKVGSTEFDFSSSFSCGSGVQNAVDVKGGIDDPTTFFSSLDFDSCNFGGFQEFPRPPFDISESSLSGLLSEPNDFLQKTGIDSCSETFR